MPVHVIPVQLHIEETKQNVDAGGTSTFQARRSDEDIAKDLQDQLNCGVPIVASLVTLISSSTKPGSTKYLAVYNVPETYLEVDKEKMQIWTNCGNGEVDGA